MARLSKWIDAVQAGGRVSDAARISLEARLSTVAYWLPLASRQIDDDIEKVHQLRVSTRRAIAALRLYRDWLPRDEYAWLTRATEDACAERQGRRVISTCWPSGSATSLAGNGGRPCGNRGRRTRRCPAGDHGDRRQCEVENRFRRKMYGLLAAVRPRGKRAEEAGCELPQLGRDAAGPGHRRFLRGAAESIERSVGTP